MIEVLSRIVSVEAIADEWRRLASGNPLLGFEWGVSAARAFCSEETLRIVCVRSESGVLRALAPLELAFQGGLRELRLLGASQLGERGGFIFEDRSALQNLCGALLAQRLPLHLSGLPAGGPEMKMLHALTKKQVVFYPQQSGIPYLRIGKRWGDYEISLKASARERIGWARRLAGAGHAVYTVEFPGKTEWDRPFEKFLDIEGRGWQAAAGSSIRHNLPLHQFFSGLFAQLAERQELLCAFLHLDEKPVAAVMAAVGADKLWILKTGYDECFARFSPGILVMHHCVRYAHERGLQAVEFLSRPQPWLETWTTDLHRCSAIEIYPGWFGSRARYPSKGLWNFMSASAQKIRSRKLTSAPIPVP